MKLVNKTNVKQKLNQTLRSWLPILQTATEDLKEILDDLLSENPFTQVHVPNITPIFSSIADFDGSNSPAKESLYEKISSQLCAPLFPTQKTQEIARLILECINHEGYFEWSDEILNGYSVDEIERIRSRFAYLEPVGVGAKDYKESFLFQLYDFCDNSEIYDLAKQIILDFENLASYAKKKHFESAMKLIKKLKNPPAIEYFEEERQIIPDLYVYCTHSGIEIKINDKFYPQINIQTEGIDEKNSFVSAHIRQAKDLIDALEMRKATLYKIGLMIIEYQYDYFFGGDIKPMRLKDIADDIARNPSTISRAIQNKYLSCSRGIIALKNFFSVDLGGEEVSNAAIKDFIKNLVSHEDRKKPLSDELILAKIKDEFGIDLVRRTITKYRKTLNIASSSQRKKMYAIKV